MNIEAYDADSLRKMVRLLEYENKILKDKLKKAGISYETCRDENIMGQKNISNLPTLEVDGILYSFKEAVDWINGGK